MVSLIINHGRIFRVVGINSIVDCFNFVMHMTQYIRKRDVPTGCIHIFQLVAIMVLPAKVSTSASCFKPSRIQFAFDVGMQGIVGNIQRGFSYAVTGTVDIHNGIVQFAVEGQRIVGHVVLFGIGTHIGEFTITGRLFANGNIVVV